MIEVTVTGTVVYTPKEMNGWAMTRILCTGYDGKAVYVNLTTNTLNDRLLRLQQGDVIQADGVASIHFKKSGRQYIQVKVEELALLEPDNTPSEAVK